METGDHEHAALICSHCGEIVGRLVGSPWTVTLPDGKIVREGDLICEDCLRDLEKRYSDEEWFSRPTR